MKISSTNPEQQLYEFEFLAEFIDPKNVRQRIKKSPFKIINALYLFQKANEEKGREHHFQGINLICKIAKIKSRRIVGEFINSPVFEVFCDIRRNFGTTHQYRLKEWVYQWMRLFWRFGMMKHFHAKKNWWLSDFKKRIKNWLVPLVQSGLTVRDIYEKTLNRNVVQKPLKVNTPKFSKVNTIHASGGSSSMHMESNLEFPVLNQAYKAARELKDRFFVKEADIYRVINSFSLSEIKGGIRIGLNWLRNGLQIQSPMAVVLGSIKKFKYGKKQNGR